MSILSTLRGVLRGSVRAFDIGRRNRRLAAIPSVTVSINTLIRTYGKSVVARSRYLATNNPYAAAAKETFISALVGDGVKPSSLVKDAAFKEALQALWLEWTDQADADGVTDFYGMQALVAAEMFEAGECFVRIRPRRAEDGIVVPMQLQLLPSEMLPLEKNESLNGNTVEMGIEFDAIGRRVAYHFLRQNPNTDQSVMTNIGSGTTVRVPASEVIHLYRPVRVGQIRGIPHTLSAMITLAMLDLYDDAELERKRTTALFAAFVTRPKAEDDDDHPLGKPTDQNGNPVDGGSQFSLEPGAVIDLDIGEDIKFSGPTDVGAQYDSFQYRMLLRCAAGFGVPYADMSGDLRQANYGSIRAGLVAFRRRIQAMQNHVVIFQFCRPIWLRFMDLAAQMGELSVTASEYLAQRRALVKVKWIPPRWEWVDPLKDRQAEKLAVDNGFKSRDDVIEAEGYDPEEVDARIAASQQRIETLGIVLAPDAAVPVEQTTEPPSAAPANSNGGQ